MPCKKRGRWNKYFYFMKRYLDEILYISLFFLILIGRGIIYQFVNIVFYIIFQKIEYHSLVSSQSIHYCIKLFILRNNSNLREGFQDKKISKEVFEDVVEDTLTNKKTIYETSLETVFGNNKRLL